MRHKMQDLFEALDLDHSGEIGFHEFMTIAGQPDFKVWLESLDIETDDLLMLFLLIDKDGDGLLTLDEILEKVPRIRGCARGIDMLAVLKGIPPFHLSAEPGSDRLKWTLAEKLSANTVEQLTEDEFVLE